MIKTKTNIYLYWLVIKRQQLYINLDYTESYYINSVPLIFFLGKCAAYVRRLNNNCCPNFNTKFENGGNKIEKWNICVFYGKKTNIFVVVINMVFTKHTFLELNGHNL